MAASPASDPAALGLTITEAADAMGVSKRTVERWIHDGDLAVFRRGRVVRVPEASIARLRAAGTASAGPPAAPRRPFGRGRRLRAGQRLGE